MYMYKYNFKCLNLCTLPLMLSFSTTEESGFIFLTSLTSYLYTWQDPSEHFFLGAEQF